MENDVLYNRIMNVVHEEYGEGSTAVANPEGEATDALEKIQIGDDVYSISGSGGNVLTLELTATEDGYDIGASFNDLKEAFVSGKKIITHVEFDVEGLTGEAWSNFDILELIESETGGVSSYSINFTFYVNSFDFSFNSSIEDPTANIIVTAPE